MKISKAVYIGLTAAALMLPLAALAIVLPNPSPVIGGGALTLTEIQDRIQQVAQFLIIISVVVAVIIIIIGGIGWMIGAEWGKTFFKNGIIGAAIVLGVGVILQTLAGLITRSFFS